MSGGAAVAPRRDGPRVGRYAVTRLGHGLIVIWVAFTAAFLLLFAIPGDAASGLLRGATGEGTAEFIEDTRARLGLDRPILVQYLDALVGAVRGDFGNSYYYGIPATEVFFENFRYTLVLTATGLTIGLAVGLGLAVAAQLGSGVLRELLVALPPLMVSLPGFWLALMLVQIFAFGLQLIPAIGNTAAAGSTVVASLALAIPGAGSVAQLANVNLDRALGSPYVATLRNWGLSRPRIVTRHALKNASLPVLTSFGTTVGIMLGGTVMTETVFSREGVGRVIVEAVDGKDMPVVLVAVTVSAVVFVLVNLLVDLAYPLIDRRIHVG